MSFKLGNTNIGSIYVGSNKIGSAYVGSVKVYQSGPSFRTVTIGSQTWMAEDLTINDNKGGIYVLSSTYGPYTYYSYAAAVRVANSISGWHLPTAAEWTTLRTKCGGNSQSTTKKMKSSTTWSSYPGTDDYGLSINAGGYMSSSTSTSANNVGKHACYHGNNSRFLIQGKNAPIIYDNMTMDFQLIRLVKDA